MLMIVAFQIDSDERKAINSCVYVLELHHKMSLGVLMFDCAQGRKYEPQCWLLTEPLEPYSSREGYKITPPQKKKKNNNNNNPSLFPIPAGRKNWNRALEMLSPAHSGRHVCIWRPPVLLGRKWVQILAPFSGPHLLPISEQIWAAYANNFPREGTNLWRICWWNRNGLKMQISFHHVSLKWHRCA